MAQSMWPAFTSAQQLSEGRGHGLRTQRLHPVGLRGGGTADAQALQVAQPAEGPVAEQHLRRVGVYRQQFQAVARAKLALQIGTECGHAAAQAGHVGVQAGQVGRAQVLVGRRGQAKQQGAEGHGAQLQQLQHLAPPHAGAVEGHHLGAVTAGAQARQLAGPEGFSSCRVNWCSPARPPTTRRRSGGAGAEDGGAGPERWRTGIAPAWPRGGPAYAAGERGGKASKVMAAREPDAGHALFRVPSAAMTGSLGSCAAATKLMYAPKARLFRAKVLAYWRPTKRSASRACRSSSTGSSKAHNCPSRTRTRPLTKSGPPPAHGTAAVRPLWVVAGARPGPRCPAAR